MALPRARRILASLDPKTHYVIWLLEVAARDTASANARDAIQDTESLVARARELMTDLHRTLENSRRAIESTKALLLKLSPPIPNDAIRGSQPPEDRRVT